MNSIEEIYHEAKADGLLKVKTSNQKFEVFVLFRDFLLPEFGVNPKKFDFFYKV